MVMSQSQRFAELKPDMAAFGQRGTAPTCSTPSPPCHLVLMCQPQTCADMPPLNPDMAAFGQRGSAPACSTSPPPHHLLLIYQPQKCADMKPGIPAVAGFGLRYRGACCAPRPASLSVVEVGLSGVPWNESHVYTWPHETNAICPQAL